MCSVGILTAIVSALQCSIRFTIFVETLYVISPTNFDAFPGDCSKKNLGFRIGFCTFSYASALSLKQMLVPFRPKENETFSTIRVIYAKCEEIR